MWGHHLVVSTILALAMLVGPLAAEAQQTRRVPRIGHLSGVSLSTALATREAFLEGLRELGYAESSNILIEWQWAEGRFDLLPDLAAELVRLRVDIIVTGGHHATVAASRATRAIPIVFLAVASPVEWGLIVSLARPDGNVTGVSSNVSAQIYAKRLALLKRMVPTASRIALIWNPDNPDAALFLQAVEGAAPALGVAFQRIKVRVSEDFDNAFVAITRARPDGLLVAADPLISSHQDRVIDFAARNLLPAMYGSREFVDAGGLMSYAPNLREIWRRGAIYVHKILKGAKPADLPVEQPTKFELVINMKTAKALGLTIPQRLLLRADEAIQ